MQLGLPGQPLGDEPRRAGNGRCEHCQQRDQLVTHRVQRNAMMSHCKEGIAQPCVQG
jgi:hypothetical protein